MCYFLMLQQTQLLLQNHNGRTFTEKFRVLKPKILKSCNFSSRINTEYSIPLFSYFQIHYMVNANCFKHNTCYNT